MKNIITNFGEFINEGFFTKKQDDNIDNDIILDIFNDIKNDFDINKLEHITNVNIPYEVPNPAQKTEKVSYYKYPAYDNIFLFIIISSTNPHTKIPTLILTDKIGKEGQYDITNNIDNKLSKEIVNFFNNEYKKKDIETLD